MLHFPRRLTFLCGPFVLFSQHQAAFASTNLGQKGEDAKQPMAVVQITGDAGSYDARREETAAKIIISADELGKFGEGNITEALKRVPGLTVVGGKEVRMRGLGAGYTQLLVDGERPGGNFTIDSVPLSAIEKIEIQRTATAEFSAEAIAGTINIVLRRVVKTARRDIKTSLLYGRLAAGGNGSIVASDKMGRFSYSLSSNLSRYHNRPESSLLEYRYSPSAVLETERYSVSKDSGHTVNFNVTPRLNWRLENGDVISSQSFLSASRAYVSGQTWTTVARGDPPWYDSVNGANRVRSTKGFSNLTWTGGAAPARYELKIGASRGHDNGNVGQTGWLRDDLLLDRNVATRAHHRGSTIAGKLSSETIAKHVITGGFEYVTDTRRDSRIQRERAIPGIAPDESDELYKSRSSRSAIFVQDDWSLSDQWSVYAGLRREELNLRSAGHSYAALRQHHVIWAPSVQALWKLPNRRDQLRAALSRTFKAPTLEELTPRLYLSTNNNEYAPDIQGNPALRPERAVGFDASFEHYWTHGAMVSVALSLRRIDDYTGRELLRSDGRWVELRINRGEARTRTIDLEAKIPGKAVASALAAWQLRAGASRNWSKVDSIPGPDNRVGQQVPLTANLGVDYTSAQLTVGGSLAFSQGADSRFSPTLSIGSGNHRDLDVYLLYKMSKDMQVRTTFRNLTADDEVATRTYAGPALARGINVTPSSRSLRVALEVKL